MKELKTRRLRIAPLADDELSAAAAAEPDPHMKSAYEEMLAGCLSAPADRLWFTEWRVLLRETGEEIGGLGFKGPPENGAVELGYGIHETHRGKGFAAEAAKALIDWAFLNGTVYFVEAESDPDNAASLRVLEKLGFSPAGTGAEGPRFGKERPASAWMSICMCLGLSLGMSLGLSLGGPGTGMTTGMSLGLALGVALGISLDAADKKKREAFRAARQSAGGTPDGSGAD